MKQKSFNSRIAKLFKLTCTEIYNYETERFDLDKAIKITRQVEEMAPTDEELSYVRKSDKSSLLHLAIYAKNAPLVAYYVDIGVDQNKKSDVGVEAAKLAEIIGDIYEDIKNAFYSAEEYLISNKVFEEFESDDETIDIQFMGAFERQSDT